MAGDYPVPTSSRNYPAESSSIDDYPVPTSSRDYPARGFYPGQKPPHRQALLPVPPPPPAGRRSRSPRRGGGGADATGKHTCCFFIGIENDDDFQVVRRIIGARGSNVKDIVAKSDGQAKVRVRGKGSGHKEQGSDKESHEPLQLCISCPSGNGYQTAVKCAQKLLLATYTDYDRWCAEMGRPDRAPELKMQEQRHKGGGSHLCVGNKGGAGNRRQRQRSNRAGPGDDDSYSDDDGNAAADDRGKRPPGAPSNEEIEQAIEDRNNARRDKDFRGADRIRDDLRSRGVVLTDEKGGHGHGLSVTSWRYWND